MDTKKQNEESHILSYGEFLVEVYRFLDTKPAEWRRGQAVFNFIDSTFGVARMVQFMDGVDCFYDDSNIDDFIEKSYERYAEMNV